MELDPTIVANYAATFLSRGDYYPKQLDDGSYVVIHKPLHIGVVMAHLRGTMTIGAYGLDPNGWAKWLCFDADTPERWDGLVGMAGALATSGIVPYLEPSRRGGHLWLFTEPIPGFQIRRFGKQLLAEQKVETIELYPKQDRPVTGPGSLVRLPLGIHRLTAKRYHFVTREGTPLAPSIREQITVLAAPERVPQPFIDQVLTRTPIAPALSSTLRFTPGSATDETVSERIKNRISVFEFVSQYVELDPQGRGYCPFHDDQHKSFQVSQERNFWHCYANCGGGSVIDFWMKWREAHHEDAGFTETITDLAKMLLK